MRTDVDRSWSIAAARSVVEECMTVLCASERGEAEDQLERLKISLQVAAGKAKHDRASRTRRSCFACLLPISFLLSSSLALSVLPNGQVQVALLTVKTGSPQHLASFERSASAHPAQTSTLFSWALNSSPSRRSSGSLLYCPHSSV